MLKKVSIPEHIKPELTKSVQNIGKDGYDYSNTEKNLIVATEKMLENAKKLK